MELFTDKTIAVAWTVGKIRPPQWSATFILKGTYKLVPGQLAVLADELGMPIGDKPNGDDPAASLAYPSDFVPQKPRADVLLVGTAHAPGNVPVRSFEAGFSLGAFSKKLLVWGERRWKSGLFAKGAERDASLTASLPIVYENSLGGPGDPKNPVGRGRDGEKVPLLEVVGRPVSGARDDADPAGFGPIPYDWEPRKSLVGTFSRKWAKDRWPWFPEDMDPAFFNAAPRDQQIEGYLRGNESITLENLRPDKPLYRAKLPGVRGRCFVESRQAQGDLAWREVPLNLDTLWIDADAETLVLVWRGNIDVRTLKLREVTRIYAVTEPVADPSPKPEFYRQRLDESLAEKIDPAEAAAEAERVKAAAAFDLEIAQLRQRFAAMDAEYAQIMGAADAEEATIIAESQARFTAEGFRNANVPTGPTAIPADFSSPALAESLQEFRSKAPETAAQYESLAAEADFAKYEKEMEAGDMVFDDDPAPWTRTTVLESAKAGQSFQGTTLTALDLSGADLSGVDFRGAIFLSAVLAGCKLAGANLTGADLRKADLSGADLTGAKLDDADFGAAQLAGVKIAGASLQETTFEKLDLKGIDFSQCTGTGVNFKNANLEGANFTGVRFPQGNFEGAKLAKARFHGAHLKDGRFEEAVGHEVDFEGADLTSLHAGDGCDFTAGNFQRIKAAGALFENAILDRANFTRAILTKAQFSNASMIETKMDRADVSQGMFDDAILQKAVLTNANFLRAGFDRADLTEANLTGSNCYEAGFWDTLTDRAELRRANLKGTLLG